MDSENSRNMAAFHSQISIGFVLNALYGLIYEMDYECHEQHKRTLDSIPRPPE